MSKGRERLVIRTGEALKDLCQRAADLSEMNLSEWARGALEQQALREVRPNEGRPLGGGEKMDPRRCIHPLTGRVDLPTKIVCGVCDGVVKIK